MAKSNFYRKNKFFYYKMINTPFQNSLNFEQLFNESEIISLFNM